MAASMNCPRLPTTDSIRELAQFWDTHDLTDFDEELEEVVEPMFERQEGLTLRLDATEAAALVNLARSLGLSEAELVREWILQQLHAA